MKRVWKKGVVAVAAAAALGVAVAGPAAAAPPGTSFDDKPDTVFVGGSDTTYQVEVALNGLYNGSPGCDTNNSSSVPASPATYFLGACFGLSGNTSGNQTAKYSNTIVAGDPNNPGAANWDHDVFVQRYPTGSSAGVSALRQKLLPTGNVPPNYQVDMARSSRPLNASGESGLNAYGYAKDGIAVFTTGGRVIPALTQAQLRGIWGCTITTWDQITGNPADAGQVIRPYGMNSSSGTYAVFRDYLRPTVNDPNAGSCVKKQSDGTFPFENDVKQIDLDPGITATEKANSIWWGSFGELTTYAFKKGSAQYIAINNGTVDCAIDPGSIAPNAGSCSYPIARILYLMVPKTQAEIQSPALNPIKLDGPVGGVGGAVKEYTQWLCRQRSGHATNPYTGDSYFDSITFAINGNNFIRTPSAQRTSGAGQCAYQTSGAL